MSSAVADYDPSSRLLDTGWTVTASERGRWTEPGDIPEIADGIVAHVPGTVAGALQAAGQWSLDQPAPIEHRDYWYQTNFEATGRYQLILHGLAGRAHVWLNGMRLHASDSMFVTTMLDVDCTGRNHLVIAFPAELAKPVAKIRRARWRPQLAPDSRRGERQTLLGRMLGWNPPVPAIGPWRPIELRPVAGPRVIVRERVVRCEGPDGVVEIALAITGLPTHGAVIAVGDATAALVVAEDGHCRANLRIKDVQHWWPHTHGAPKQYPVSLRLADRSIDLGPAGFRTLAIDRGADGRDFALMVNDTRVFCRGACWTTGDIVNLSATPAHYEPWLQQATAAGMNMLRVPGVGVYEATCFYQRCAELGVLVWQDFMLANFDYPAEDPAFAALIDAEATQFLVRTQSCASLAVLCGGSEVYQQAAMLGMPAGTWASPLYEAQLPAIAQRLRPDVPYVVNSPSGGDLPFMADAGVSHYYGVGAYLRPLATQRLDHVRFASECLAFAHVPDAAGLERLLSVPAVHHPRWKARVPRDPGAAWDFDDVREHYLATMFGGDPTRLRTEDPERYLDLSRAVTVEIAERAFAEWRRPASPTNGALMWTFQDVWPGAGWGVVNADGSAKPVWYGLKRAFKPLTLTITDEGLGGLALHVINEHAGRRALTLSLTLLADSGVTVAAAKRDITLDARSGQTTTANDLFGRFLDTTYAYRFGPRGFECAVGQLHDVTTSALVSETLWFPANAPLVPRDCGLEAKLVCDASAWSLRVTTKRAARFVNVYDHTYSASNDWLHISPLNEQILHLVPRPGRTPAASARPSGEIRALNHSRTITY